MDRCTWSEDGKPYTPMAYAGFTWLPELIFSQDHKIKSMGSIIGAGVWLVTFLLSGQIGGLKGITMHSILYGGGSVVGSFITLLQ